MDNVTQEILVAEWYSSILFEENYPIRPAVFARMGRKSPLVAMCSSDEVAKRMALDHNEAMRLNKRITEAEQELEVWKERIGDNL